MINNQVLENAGKLAKNQKSSTLNLFNKGIIDSDIPTIVNFLIKNTWIDGLTLYRNNLSDDGVKNLVSLVEKEKLCLRSLSLINNDITDKTVAMLAENEAFVKKLSLLNLDDNNEITSESFASSAILYKINPTIKIVLPINLDEKFKKLNLHTPVTDFFKSKEQPVLANEKTSPRNIFKKDLMKFVMEHKEDIETMRPEEIQEDLEQAFSGISYKHPFKIK